MVPGRDCVDATDCVVGATSPVDVVEVPVEEDRLLEDVEDTTEPLEVEDVEALVLDLCSELLVDVLAGVVEV